MLVRSEDVEWTDIWNTVGLRGTASDQFALNDFFVRSDHSITREFDRECRENGPLYRMGAGTCYQVGFAGVACGIARTALDNFVEMTRNKVPRGARSALRDNAVVQTNLAQAEVNLRAARGYRAAVDGRHLEGSCRRRHHHGCAAHEHPHGLHPCHSQGARGGGLCL